MVRWIAGLMLCLAWVSTCAWSAEGGYRFAPDPAEVSVDSSVDPEEVATSSSGLKYLVASDQIVLTGEQPVWHRAISYQITEERGLENAGQLSMEYQPDYQRLEIHAIEVWRDGQRFDRRRNSRIDVLRRESDLESGILDGRLTLNITVPDLRIGDRLIYRYSVVGYNPVFGAGYYDSYSARFSVPVGLRLVSFIYPKSMALHWRAHHEGFATRTRAAGDALILEASARNLAAVVEEDGAPSTYNPYGRIEVSTAKDWGEVADWAMPLYPRTFEDRRIAAGLVERLKLDSRDPMGSALRATAFVQGDIRYTGLNMGENSHAPSPPESTLERRFGDCKDKTILLIALLSEAGIAADPVLVHTEHREAVRGRLPSPLAFDHVIVRAKIEGREIWIDPTLERERGDFAARRSLPYRYGLPIAANAASLVPIPDSAPGNPQVDVAQTISFAVTDEAASADFEVATDYRQGFADSVRRQFASDGAEELGKGYLQYMQGFYEGLRAEGAPAAGESEIAFQVKEKYRLNWSKAEEGTAFGIVIFQILDWLPKIADGERQSPLALGGPRHGRQTIRSILSGGWSISSETQRVDTPYFRFERKVEVQDGALVIVADWRRLTDEIPASEVLKARKDIAKVRELLQYDVDLEPEAALLAGSATDWLWPLAVAVLTGILLAASWLLRKRMALVGMLYRPRATIAAFVARGGVGNGGWVVLLAVILLDAVFEIGSRLAAGLAGPMLVGTAIGILIGLCLRWLIWSGLVKGAFRMLGQRLEYSEVLKAGGWAASPMICLGIPSLIALKFDFSMLMDDAILTPEQWSATLVAAVLLLGGALWALIALVNAYAGLAGIRRRRALAAMAIAVALTLAMLLPFALIFLAARYGAS